MIGPIPIENINIDNISSINNNNNNNNNDPPRIRVIDIDDITNQPPPNTNTNPINNNDPTISVIPTDQNNNNNNNNNNNDNNNNNNNNNPNTRRRNHELWIEHERRQRTIRFLMMFLMMLILMDGEQSSNEEMKKKHQDAYLRKKKGHRGNHLNSTTNYNDYNNSNGNTNSNSSSTRFRWNNNTLIENDLFNARMELDSKIRYSYYHGMYLTTTTTSTTTTSTSTTNHNGKDSRLMALFKLNNGIDEEMKIWNYVLQQEEKEELDIINGNGPNLLPAVEQNDNNGNNNDNDSKNKDNNNNNNNNKDVEEEKQKEEIEMKRKVYHYPRNATGHFRGHWTRIMTKRPSSRKDDSKLLSSSSSSQTPTSTSTSTSTSQNKNNDTIKQSSSTTTATTTHTYDTRDTQQIKNIIKKDTSRYSDICDDRLGLYILPRNMKLDGNDRDQLDLVSLDDDRNTGITIFDISGRRSSVNGNGSGNGNRNNSTNAMVKPSSSSSSSSSKKEELYITEEEGKLHFHFYSRSIRGMKEISLIDGYVKLRDINDYGFTNPKKHLFLRVHGIIIHSIGRISLVANDIPLRSAFVLFKEDEGKGTKKDGVNDEKNMNGCIGVSENENDKETVDMIESKQRKRRRLQESIVDLDQTTSSTSKFNNNEEIDHVLKQKNDSNDKKNNNNRKEEKKSFQEKIDDIRTRALWMFSDLFNIGDNGNDDWKLFSSNIDGTDKDSSYADWNEFMESNYDEQFITRDQLLSLSSSSEQRMKRGRRLLQNEGEEDKGTHSDETKKISKSEQRWTSSVVQPYPYIPYEKNITKKGNLALLRKTYASIPEVLFNNYCEFEINLNVNETQWTVSEWRKMFTRISRDINSINPFKSKLIDDGDDDESIDPQYEQTRDEALVMNLFGIMDSPNCDFTLSLNATAFRTDWEQTKYKATIYSVYMMLACLVQIVVLLRQLIYAQSQMATRVSLLCIGWQTVIDAILCIEHIMLCLMVPPVSTAFFMVALFKFLLFYVIEMKYMVMIVEARSNAAGNSSTAYDMRRRLATLQLRFFSALFLSIMAVWYLVVGQQRRKLVFMIMYSFWVPQIAYNIFTEAKKPLHKHYIYGNSITRLNLPLILFGIPKNFMQEIEPDFPLDFSLCVMLVIWVGIQTGVLIGQTKYGARFMIPARFLPPKYNYARKIPASMLPAPSLSSNRCHSSSDSSDTSGLLENDMVNEIGPRNRKEKRSRNSESNGITTVHEEEGERPTIDCVICYNPIDVLDRRTYMLAPCDHIFHRSCLEQWMDVKMECPICRKHLPEI